MRDTSSNEYRLAVVANNFSAYSLEPFSEDLFALEWDLDEGYATEARVARTGAYLVELADDLLGQVKSGPHLNDDTAAHVNKLRAAASKAQETGEEVQEACDGEYPAPVSESSESCQGGYDRLWASYVELEKALAPLIAPLDE